MNMLFTLSLLQTKLNVTSNLTGTGSYIIGHLKEAIAHCSHSTVVEVLQSKSYFLISSFFEWFIFNIIVLFLLSGPTWCHKEGELSPTESPAGGRAQQLCGTLQLQQHERQQDGQLHSGP